MLARTDIKTVGQWAISGKTISAVYYRNMPYDSALYSTASVSRFKLASYTHYIYLLLSTDLAAGTYTITPPASTGISAYSSFHCSPSEIVRAPKSRR